MEPPDEMAQALEPVLDAFLQLGVEYRIGGSVASSALGIARSTLDVDLVARLEPSQASGLCERLSSEYYADESAIRDAIERRASFNLIHLVTMIKLDIFVLKTGAFDQASFQRSRLEPLGGLPEVALCTAEDVILRKLEWYRDGGEVSERQWSDVLGILRVQSGSLDTPYLDHWAAELRLTDLLSRVRSEVSTG